MRRFRTRLVVTVIGLVLLTALLLGAGSYLFVSRSLRGQFAEDAAAQAEFDIAELATEERLPAGVGPGRVPGVGPGRGDPAPGRRRVVRGLR